MQLQNRRTWGYPVAWLGNQLTDADAGKEKSRHLTCAVWPPGFGSYLCVGFGVLVRIVSACSLDVLVLGLLVCTGGKMTHERGDVSFGVTVSWLKFCDLDM